MCGRVAPSLKPKYVGFIYIHKTCERGNVGRVLQVIDLSRVSRVCTAWHNFCLVIGQAIENCANAQPKEFQMFKSLKVAAAVAALSLGAGAAQAIPVIDDFTTTQASTSDTTVDGQGVWAEQVVQTGSAFILGKYRDLYVEKLGGTGSAAAQPAAEAYINGSDGFVEYASGNNVSGRIVIRWDGVATPGAGVGVLGTPDVDGLGSVDLSQAMAFGLFASPDNSLNVIMRVWSGSSNAMSSYATTIAAAPELPSGDRAMAPYYLSFANFAGADFTDVGAIELELGGLTSSARDFGLTLVEIPEPGTLALSGLALLAMGAARRRKSA